MQIKNTITKIRYLLKETIRGFIDDNGMKLSAALSYYTFFSLPPLLIIIISLCGYFFGAEAVKGEIFGQINGLVGNDVAIQIQEILKNVNYSKSGAFITILGIIILILIWVYYSAIILYFGAEFTKIYAQTHGQKIIPNSYSIQIEKVK
jgi:membrane protein